MCTVAARKKFSYLVRSIGRSSTKGVGVSMPRSVAFQHMAQFRQQVESVWVYKSSLSLHLGYLNTCAVVGVAVGLAVSMAPVSTRCGHGLLSACSCPP